MNAKTNSRSPIARTIAMALLVITIVSTMLFTAGCKKNKNQAAPFDYLTADLSEYIEFTKDYKNFKVEIDIAAPHDIDVQVAINSMLCSDKDKTPLYGGGDVVKFETITNGDVVSIWYRGYLIGDDGEKIIVPGMSNFGNASAYALEIGSTGFIPGFELDLIGEKPSEHSKFEKIEIGSINENQIAYVTYTKTTSDGSTSKVTESNVRMDLSEDLDAIYGFGFQKALMKLSIGEKTEISTVIDGVTHKYSDLKISFVTECEDNPIVVETYFPYDYSKKELRNETAYFEVYVESLVAYQCPEFTDEYLQKKIDEKKINVDMDTLNACEGSTLTEKYRNYAAKVMNDIYEEEYNALVEEQVWTYLDSISVAKKYPEDKVQAIYEAYIDDIVAQFRDSGGQIYDSTTGSNKTYSTLDAYATVYVGAKNGENWKDVVYKESQGFIKERLTMFYILKAEGLVPSESVFQAEKERIRQEYIDEYIGQYLSYMNKTKEDYTDAEYQALIDECVRSIEVNFDEEYFSVRTYYTILAKTIVKWPEVSTLDDRRSYPQDK